MSAPHFELTTTPIEAGTTLIEASAGTGKTYCLAGLVVRLLVERQVEAIGRILVVTFTNAAADELQGRIREAVRHAREVLSRPPGGPGDSAAATDEPYLEALRQRFGPAAAEPLREALLAFDDLKVATIHGFCKQVLESHSFESGLPFDPQLVEDDEALLRSAAEDIWRRRLYPPGEEAGLLAALAAGQGWTPSTFLGDYREMHRHPRTLLLPPPLPLAAALARLENERQAIAPLFEPAPLRLALSRLRFKDPGTFGPARLAALADEAAAFFAGEPAALPALGPLRHSQLRKAVDPGSRQALDHLEFAHAADQLHGRIGEVEHALRAEMVAELEGRLAEIKQRDAIFAFDDLLRRLRAVLADPQLGDRLADAVRRRYGVALIDEFQDTDLVQYEIFRRLFGDSLSSGPQYSLSSGHQYNLPLFLIGDPKQAIYRFRGADVFAYLTAKNAARRGYTLARNWRSEGRLVEAVDALFSGRRFPFVFQQIDFPRVEAAAATRTRFLRGDSGIPFSWHWLDLEESGEKAEAAALDWLGRAVAAQLAAGLELVDGEKSRPLEAGDLAVLVRTNGEAAAAQQALRARGVAAVVARSGDIFHSEEMAELEILVGAIVDPGYAGRLRAASATLFFGDDAAALALLEADDHLWQERVAFFDELRERWRRAGFVAAMQDLLRRRDVRRRLLVLRDGERRLTNWQHAVELVHQAIAERQLQPTAVIAWLAAERARASHARDSSELRLESDAMAVKIVTVHKSKGLEYEVVFCPFLWRTRRADGVPVLAHVNDGQAVVYDFGSPELERHRLLAEAERLSEDARLLYVALTRARRRCHVLWGRLGQRRRAAATALAYLLHAAQTPLELGRDAVLQASAGVAGLFAEIEGRADLWLADLERLVRSAPQAMAIVKVASQAEVPPAPASGSGAGIHARVLPAALAGRLEPWRIASFSSLARGTAAALPEIAEYQDPSWPSPRPAKRPTGLFAFARGTRAGSALHEILEEVDFAQPRAAATEALVRRILWRHGLAEARQHDGGESYDPVAAVLEMLERLAACGLPAGPDPHPPTPLSLGRERGGTQSMEGLRPSSSPDGTNQHADPEDQDPGSKRGEAEVLHNDPSGHEPWMKIQHFDPRNTPSGVGRGEAEEFPDGPSGHEEWIHPPLGVEGGTPSIWGLPPLRPRRGGQGGEVRISEPTTFVLAEVAREQMAIEWEFHLPLDPLSTRGLARIFGRFEDELPRGYAARVERLGDRPVRGFLKGFVDLVFGHGDRYYLIDWKSNHLGNSPADYPRAALELAMTEHHYVLQYLLYTVALHRHLHASLPGYDYDRHFGGCFYLFLRGLEPGTPETLFEKPLAQSGLYAARPSRELVAALDAAITHQGEAP